MLSPFPPDRQVPTRGRLTYPHPTQNKCFTNPGRIHSSVFSSTYYLLETNHLYLNLSSRPTCWFPQPLFYPFPPVERNCETIDTWRSMCRRWRSRGVLGVLHPTSWENESKKLGRHLDLSRRRRAFARKKRRGKRAGRKTARMKLPSGWCLLPCDHGLEFWHQLMW